MIKAYDKGSSIIIQGVEIFLPPVGYGVHPETGELHKVEILKRSPNKKDQYWEAPFTPDDIADWNEWYEEEKEQQEFIPDFIHPELQKVRQREWNRRLYGLWVWINGTPTYIPGIFYFFLSYWRCLDTENGLPDYRLIDLEYFYFWLWVTLNPKAYGMIEIRKRRDGKSYRAACIMYEVVSRTKQAHGGIQSKDEESAQEFFQNKLIAAFKSLPKFFIPEYDTSKGDTPKESLMFFRTSKKGKGAKVSENKKVPELKSSITFKNRQAKAYDGWRLRILVLDESGKVEVDVMGRHAVVKYCLMDNRRRIIGKMIVTSTVEQIGVKFGFKKLWEGSNQFQIEKGTVTKTGLFKFFIPASRSGDYDIYGVPDEVNTLKAIKEDRESKADDPDELNDILRKEPLSEKEAFMVKTTQCHFNPVALNERLGELGLLENVTERGNFIWKEKDKEVKWEKSPIGKWEICHLPEQPNKVNHSGSRPRPANDFDYICGVDTIDINLPKDEKRASKPAAVIMKRANSLNNSIYNGTFVCKYIPLKRMKDATEFYEDLIKMLVYYGCSCLYERNKSRLAYYLQERGYYQFLMYLPGEKEPGVYAGTESKTDGLELLQEHVRDNISKTNFSDLIEDWLKFDIADSTENDLSMASMWCVVADKNKSVRRKRDEELPDITTFFPLHKAG